MAKELAMWTRGDSPAYWTSLVAQLCLCITHYICVSDKMTVSGSKSHHSPSMHMQQALERALLLQASSLFLAYSSKAHSRLVACACKNLTAHKHTQLNKTFYQDNVATKQPMWTWELALLTARKLMLSLVGSALPTYTYHSLHLCW